MPSCIAYLWNHKLEGFGLILLRTCWRPCAICVARLLALHVRMRVHAIIPLICLAISSCICCRRFPSPMLAHVFSWAVFAHPQKLRLCARGCVFSSCACAQWPTPPAYFPAIVVSSRSRSNTTRRRKPRRAGAGGTPPCTHARQRHLATRSSPRH
jgi:hypothetical protein